MAEAAIAAQPEKLAIEQFTDRSPAKFDLGTNLAKPDNQTIQQFNSSMHRYSELERLNNNTFFYNMNRIQFAQINFPGIGDALFNMVQRTRKAFDERIAALDAPPKHGNEYTHEEMIEKQIGSYLTNIEFDLVSKSVSKSVENIYILLRQ